MATSKIDAGRQVAAGTVTNTEIAAGAAIALTKLAQLPLRADGGQAMTANLPAGGFKITGLVDGSADTDSCTVGQARQFAASKDWKDAVDVASTANVVIASALENGDIIDGVTLTTGMRVLLKNQTTGSENGIYVVPASGAASRASDADTSAEVTAGLTVVVRKGTQAGFIYTLTTDDPITLNTTALTFTQTGSSGSGSVTTVSVATANGFAGSVSNASTTPAITVSTTITGVLKGNGTAISAATAGTDFMAPSSFVTREVPSGTKNSSNTAFTLANTPLSGTEEVYLNGMLQNAGGNDYSITGTAITMVTAPASTDVLLVNYRK
ncbi:MAG TPA: hypothetical protein VHL57_03880 [Flavobacteriales bacterium]|nr:hypothetical protein [Flavobacteriales bacterium]